MAKFTIDLLTGNQFLLSGDFNGSGGTTPSSGGTYPEVNNFSDLPTASDNPNEVYLVRNSTGVYLINRKEAGLYYSNGTDWKRLGNIPSFFNSNNFQIYDGVDNTKGIVFDTSNISTSNFRTLTIQDSNGTIAYVEDISVNYVPYIGATTDIYLGNNNLITNGLLNTSGLIVGYVEKNTNYTIIVNDYTINCIENSFTVTLPSSVEGQIYNIKNSGNGTIIINTLENQLIDGQLTQTLNQFDSIKVQGTGSGWIII